MTFAQSDLSLLITGETGTGKDHLAKLIHDNSPRAKGNFININCAAIPVELAESEYFGHEKGAYTNASDRKPGLFEGAHGGTLFLNEIAELPHAVQTKLLRALEDREFNRLGATSMQKIDFRLITATNTDLLEAVRQRKFRADLYYRLAVMTLEVPPLSKRGDDAFLLVEHFLAEDGIRLDGVDPVLVDTLRRNCREYKWGGNVRELINFVKSSTQGERKNAESVCKELIKRCDSTSLRTDSSSRLGSLNIAVEEFERSVILRALDECRWIIRRAADLLEIPEGTLRSRMKRLGIQFKAA
jgi:transcriptional regulator with GAF, ATPase, and Fis domain